MSDVKVENIKRHAGIAGQYSITADVTYADEPTEMIEFVGSVYGGPVVMVTRRDGRAGHSAAQTFVTSPERFGEFGEEWVRRFFTQS